MYRTLLVVEVLREGVLGEIDEEEEEEEVRGEVEVLLDEGRGDDELDP